MANNTVSNTFEIFITCVDSLGPMLKIWGQTDRETSMYIERILKDYTEHFETNAFLPDLSCLMVGSLVCAKYKDGLYYRAQVLHNRQLAEGKVDLKFIDYGNVDQIGIEYIRLFDNVPVALTTIKAQAIDFVLANVINQQRCWDNATLAFIHQEICYMELPCTILGAIHNYRFVKITFHHRDFADYLIEKGLAAPIPLATQELVMRAPRPLPQMSDTVVAGVEFVAPTPVVRTPILQVREICNYKSIPLEQNSEHNVYVSYVEDGPYLFSIQLQSCEEALEKLMIEINQTTLLPLVETPIVGAACMARCLEDGSICRAVVVNLLEDKCTIFYVDFGNTDILPFCNIFQIPFKYVLPKAMSMRFKLAGLTNINVTNEMKCAFKEYVTNKLLTLKVLNVEGSPCIKYCELYDNNKNIIHILYESTTEYQAIPVSKGMQKNVIVSFIEGCKRFFVQLKECSESLNSLMLALSRTSESAPPLDGNDMHPGMPCVAFYSTDNQWYRARIISVIDSNATVRYVDYGNEDSVPLHSLKKIDPNFVNMLPVQAIECCLYGYQNMSFNNDIENVFESLTLECEFTMKVIGIQANEFLLVDLFDCSGNNVAALLIEKLAAQQSQISPLASNQVTKSIISTDETIHSSDSEKSFNKMKSPNFEQDNLTWRQSNNKQFNNAGNEKKLWRNNPEKKSWRNTEDTQQGSDWPQNNNWNGDSSDSKPFPKTDRPISRNTRNRPFDDNNTPSERGPSNKKPFDDNNSRQDKFSNNRKPFERTSSRDNANWQDGSESEKSWSGNAFSNRSGKSIGLKTGYKQPHRDDTRRKIELPPQELAPLDTQFTTLELSPGLLEDINISWFYDPENFFCQILSYQKDFRDMMTEIQSAYIGRPPVNTTIPVGSSVIAEFKEDSILYRATVLEDKSLNYKVQYVDFGNISLVSGSKIWQVETKFMKTPAQAIRCGISNIKPLNEVWPVSAEVDNIFNKDSFACTFENVIESKYAVQLTNDNISVKEQLIESGLAVDNELAAESSNKISDDPVELYILIGQIISVRLSYIVNFTKFYAQLEKTKAVDIISQINMYMQSVDTNTLLTYELEQLVTGTACITKIDDNWHRAVVTEADSETINVSYPDTGATGEHSLNQLFALPAELCAFWYQAFECTLSYVTPDVLSEEEFKQTWEEKDVILYVDNVEEDRLIVTLYDTEGQQLDLNKSEESAYPTVDPVCALPVFTSTIPVWVSHINNVSSLYLQRQCDSEAIELLLSNMFEHYETNGEAIIVEVGQLCCIKSSDENWYRARIEESNDDTVKALYIDYGNSEVVPTTNIKALEKQFHEPHELALHVALNVDEISEDFTEKLKEITEGQLFDAKLVYGESYWMAELSNNNININQTLTDLNLVALPEVEVPNTEVDVIEPPAQTEDTENQADVVVEEVRAQITITHIDSPSEFYVQLLANEESINLLQSDLQQRIESLIKLEGADIGVLCAANYSVDELWYRAEVLDADADITTVRFVDYGNTDVIDNHTSELKTLPADLLAIDKYARQCSLNIKPAKDEEWAQEACEIFETVMSSETIYADIVYQDEKNKTYVELYVDGENIATKLLDANLAVSIVRDDEEHLANNTGFISHLNSPAEFWIQLESSVPDLEMIADRLASANTFPDLQDLSPGILCAANFPDDDMWYRARILSITVAGVEVLFIDYGNSSTAMNLKVLPEDLIQTPALAQKCSLNKSSTVSQWSEQATAKFQEISADGVTIFSIKKLTAGETSVVELFIDDCNVSEQLLNLCEMRTEAERVSPVGEANYINVHVTHIESPSLFWVQKMSDYDTIEEINESLTSANSFKQLTNWNGNTVCAALYTDSGIWYRAKILEYVEQYEVLLIDYGNILLTNEVRAIPAALEAIPPLAINCALELPEGCSEWNASSSIKFNDILAESYAECQIEFIDNAIPRKVRLLYNGENIYDEICYESVEGISLSDIENLNVANQLSSELSSTMNIIEAEKEKNDKTENSGTVKTESTKESSQSENNSSNNGVDSTETQEYTNENETQETSNVLNRNVEDNFEATSEELRTEDANNVSSPSGNFNVRIEFMYEEMAETDEILTVVETSANIDECINAETFSNNDELNVDTTQKVETFGISRELSDQLENIKSPSTVHEQTTEEFENIRPAVNIESTEFVDSGSVYYTLENRESNDVTIQEVEVADLSENKTSQSDIQEQSTEEFENIESSGNIEPSASIDSLIANNILQNAKLTESSEKKKGTEMCIDSDISIKDDENLIESENMNSDIQDEQSKQLENTTPSEVISEDVKEKDIEECIEPDISSKNDENLIESENINSSSDIQDEQSKELESTTPSEVISEDVKEIDIEECIEPDISSKNDEILVESENINSMSDILNEQSKVLENTTPSDVISEDIKEKDIEESVDPEISTNIEEHFVESENINSPLDIQNEQAKGFENITRNINVETNKNEYTKIETLTAINEMNDLHDNLKDNTDEILNKPKNIHSALDTSLTEPLNKIKEKPNTLPGEKKSTSEYKEENIVYSRPTTPHCDKIVPGCISRGTLEEIIYSGSSDTEAKNLEVSLDKDNQDIPEPVIKKPVDAKEQCETRDTIFKEVSQTISRPSTPKTPSEEKIVPGSISRGINPDE